MLRKKLLAAGALALPLALAVSGCGAAESHGSGYARSVSKKAESSEEAVADGLLPSWVPPGGSRIKLEQRTTGHERIFTMEYFGTLPKDQCLELARAGAPSTAELAAGYVAEPRTTDLDPADFATFRTLEARW